jgi:hypothetical protein
MSLLAGVVDADSLSTAFGRLDIALAMVFRNAGKIEEHVAGSARSP